MSAIAWAILIGSGSIANAIYRIHHEPSESVKKITAVIELTFFACFLIALAVGQ